MKQMLDNRALLRIARAYPRLKRQIKALRRAAVDWGFFQSAVDEIAIAIAAKDLNKILAATLKMTDRISETMFREGGAFNLPNNAPEEPSGEQELDWRDLSDIYSYMVEAVNGRNFERLSEAVEDMIDTVLSYIQMPEGTDISEDLSQEAYVENEVPHDMRID